jgi:hypothetical protein|tara:strand:+ start:5125 stop:5373 length:249 start_codon:yes stop_codon:yes gene_type:complete
MVNYYQPDMGSSPDNPFARNDEGKLVRRSFWLDMADRSLILAMTQGVGANLTNEQKRTHLEDIGRISLIENICTQEIIPPNA